MRLVLIGGGEIGRGSLPYETCAIDTEIVSMCGKDHPNFLFIGLASSYADSYYDTIKKIYQKLGCHTVYLKKNNLVHNPELVRQKFMEADIIYVGGGDTLKLFERIDEYHLKDYFIEALNRNCVLAGISAGAILFSKEGYSDSLILRGESEEYTFLSGFGFVNLSISPHYESDSLKTHQLKDVLKNSSRIVYGIQNGAALKILDGQMSVISSSENATVYELTYDNQFLEKKI